MTKGKFKSGSNWEPHLNVKISSEQYYKLQDLIPHGLKKAIFQAIIDDVVKILEEPVTRKQFIGLIIDRKIDVPRMMIGADNDNK